MAYRESAASFRGTVTQIESQRGVLVVTFNVMEWFKGQRLSRIAVETSSYVTACGFKFEKAVDYIVYAYLGGRSGRLSTGICTGTKPAVGATDELEILRSLGRGKLEPRIYGHVNELLGGISPLPLRERRAMSGVEVVAESARKRFKAQTDDEGRFRIINVPAGSYRVRPIPAPGYRIGGDYWEDPLGDRKDYAEVIVSSTEAPGPVEFMLRVNGRISGRVFDENGKPARKGIRLSVIEANASPANGQDAAYIPAYTNEDGAFTFGGLPAGKYLLGINLDVLPHRENPYPTTFYRESRNVQNATTIQLETGEHRTGYDVRLPAPIPTRTVTGRVVNEDGQPARGALVFVTRAVRSDFREQVKVMTDSHGDFRADCLVGFSYEVSAQDSTGYGSMSLAGDASTGPLRIVLRKDKQ